MSEPLYTYSKWGQTIKVYKEKIIQTLGGRDTMIPTSSIAEVESGLKIFPTITIRMNDGRKHKLSVNLKEKQELLDAIYSARG